MSGFHGTVLVKEHSADGVQICILILPEPEDVVINKTLLKQLTSNANITPPSK